MPRKYTEARKENNRKWDSANLDRISVALPKGSREKIKAHAESRGESMNAFIGRAIDEAMQRDGAAGETCIKESLFAGTTYAKCMEEKKDWQTVRVEVQEHEQPERVVKVFHVQPQEQPEPEKRILHYTPSEPVEVRPPLTVVLHEDEKE